MVLVGHQHRDRPLRAPGLLERDGDARGVGRGLDEVVGDAEGVEEALGVGGRAVRVHPVARPPAVAHHQHHRDLERDGIPRDEREFHIEGELRFNRQKWELAIPFRSLNVDDDVLAQLEQDFRQEYIARFGSGSLMPGARPDLSTVRVIGIGRTAKADIAASTGSAELRRSGPAAKGSRMVMVDQGRGMESVKVVGFDQLARNETLAGPILVDGGDTTIWVPANSAAQLHENGTLIVTVKE